MYAHILELERCWHWSLWHWSLWHWTLWHWSIVALYAIFLFKTEGGDLGEAACASTGAASQTTNIVRTDIFYKN